MPRLNLISPENYDPTGLRLAPAEFAIQEIREQLEEVSH